MLWVLQVLSQIQTKMFFIGHNVMVHCSEHILLPYKFNTAILPNHQHKNPLLTSNIRHLTLCISLHCTSINNHSRLSAGFRRLVQLSQCFYIYTSDAR